MGGNRRDCRAAAVLAALVCCLGLLWASSSVAATLTVDTTTDTNTRDDGICSLREAIEAVDHAPTGSDCGAAAAGSNTIVLPASRSPYALTIPTTGVDDNSTGDLDLAAPGPVTISGAGVDATTVSAATLGNRILHVISGEVTIEDLTLTGGHAPSGAEGQNGFLDMHGLDHDPTVGGDGFNGGGIFSGGTLTLDRVAVTDNFAGNGGRGGDGETLVAGTTGGRGGAGGGIDNVGTLTLSDVTISGNHAGDGGDGGNGGAGGSGGKGGSGGCCGDGGGLYSAGSGVVTIDGSTFTGNVAGGGGSGGGGGEAVGFNSTAGNGGSGAGGSSGGAIAMEGGTLILRDSTITGNQAGPGGDGGGPGGGDFTSGSGPPPPDGGAAGNGSAGGGVFVVGASAALTGVTISANAPGGPGTPGPAGGVGATAGSPGNPAFAGGIDGGPGSSVALEDTLLSLDPMGNCGGTIGNGGSNLSFGDGNCPVAFAGGDPKLAGLADNGGPTETMDLGAGSAAIDAGASGCRPFDQRGVARPSGTACDIGAYEVTLPAVDSLAASAITDDEARLAASVTANAATASVQLEYGTTTAYGSRAAVAPVVGTAPTPVQTAVSGLAPGTVYHFRVVATSSDGSTASDDGTFTTSAASTTSSGTTGGFTSEIAGSTSRPRAPVLGRIAVVPRRFHAAPGRHGERAGARISYSDTQAATTTFVVFRLLPGVTRGGRCVNPGRRVHGRRCSRQIAVGDFTHVDVAGRNELFFDGRVGGRRLVRGSYIVRATPATAASRGAAVRFGFAIV